MSAPSSPRRAARWAALLLVPTLLLGGCSTSTLFPDVAQTTPTDTAGGAPAPMAPADTGGGTESTRERQVARSAYLSVTVDDVVAAAGRLRELATALDGWVVDENLSLAQEPGWRSASSVSVSVPATRLDEALDRIGQLGTVTQRSVQAVDVTEPVEDTDARIRTLEASIARISELMARAGTVAEIAQVEKELTQRQSDLEVLRAERERLRTAVERATVSVTLLTPSESVTTNPILVGLARGWEAFLGSIALALTILGGLLPFLFLAALIAVPVIAWWRRRRRKVTRRSRETAATGGAEQDPGNSAASTAADTTPRPTADEEGQAPLAGEAPREGA